jgi:signal transduction histidine kinase
LATGLGLYRIVQEALANVAKHDPSSRTLVTLDIGAETARVKVRSRRPAGAAPSTATVEPVEDGGPNGLGIKGMVERAALLGGSLSAHPDRDGWTVEAAVPRATSAGVGPLDSSRPTEAVQP